MKRFLALILSVVLVFGVTACGDSNASNEKKTKLVLGTSADYAPFEFIVLDDAGKQQYVGIDVELARKLAKDMGLELEIVNMNFDNLMLSLQKGEIDMVIAAVEETEERAAVADFSDPYYTDYPPMILVRKGDEGKYTSTESFDGKTVGAQTGTTKTEIVTGDLNATLLGLTSVPDLVNNLVYEKCDAIVVDGAVAMEYAQTNDDIVIADVELGAAYPYRVAVKKGDPSGLLTSFNTTIKKVLEDGTMESWIENADSISDQAVQ